MRDLSRVGASGTGKSRGYAFINFTEHSDALHALRATNNKPEVFGDKKVCELGCYCSVAVNELSAMLVRQLGMLFLLVYTTLQTPVNLKNCLRPFCSNEHSLLPNCSTVLFSL